MLDDRHKVFALTLAALEVADGGLAEHVPPVAWARLQADGLVVDSFLLGKIATAEGRAELLRMVST